MVLSGRNTVCGKNIVLLPCCREWFFTLIYLHSFVCFSDSLKTIKLHPYLHMRSEVWKHSSICKYFEDRFNFYLFYFISLTMSYNIWNTTILCSLSLCRSVTVRSAAASGDVQRLLATLDQVSEGQITVTLNFSPQNLPQPFCM